MYTTETCSVWRISLSGEETLWDGPLSAEDAEKVRFTRARDAEAQDDYTTRYEVRSDGRRAPLPRLSEAEVR